MKKRNIALCFIFTFITCGIYALYWFVQLTNNTNELANPAKKTSGGVALILNIITGGIYGWYWAYKLGTLLDSVAAARGEAEQSRGVVYLVLQIVFAPIAWILMQSTINSMIEG